MRYIPRSSCGSTASGPMYYIPGGFCVPAQPSAPEHDVVPDLVARPGVAAPVKSTGRFTTLLQAGCTFFGRLIATSSWRKAGSWFKCGAGEWISLGAIAAGNEYSTVRALSPSARWMQGRLRTRRQTIYTLG